MSKISSRAVTPQLLSVKDTATYLSVSSRTVRRLIDKGDIPIVRIGGSIRISVGALNAYIALRTESEPWRTAIMKVTPSH
jgi:excisionase family DNA binding protein